VAALEELIAMLEKSLLEEMAEVNNIQIPEDDLIIGEPAVDRI
jgi:hypothetical protein